MKTKLSLIALVLSGIFLLPDYPLQAKKECRQCKMKGSRQGGMKGFKFRWKKLPAEKREKLMELRLSFKRRLFPLKAEKRKLKVDLAVLMTSDKPNRAAINGLIDKIVSVKREIMRLKAEHRLAVRKELPEKMRAFFDMRLLKKSFHGKKRWKRGRR